MLEILADYKNFLPWNKPAWLVIHKEVLLNNISKFFTNKHFILDASSNIIKTIMLKLHSDIQKLGCNKILLEFNKEFIHKISNITSYHTFAWTLFILPYFELSYVPDIIKLNAIPIINHISEAIIISNYAQSLETDCAVLINLRSDSVYADAGLTSALSILELLPTLPNIKLGGFYCQNTTSASLIYKLLDRELQRYYNTSLANANLHLISSISNNFSELSNNFYDSYFLKTVGLEVLGIEQKSYFNSKSNNFSNNSFNAIKNNYNENLNFSNLTSLAFSVLCWAYPINFADNGVIVQLDLGIKDFFYPQLGSKVIVESCIGKIINIFHDKTIIFLNSIPQVSTPWKCQIVGTQNIFELNEAIDMKFYDFSLFHLIDNLAKNGLYSIV